MKNKVSMSIYAGSEKKFTLFLKNIKKTDNVALISHTDLDGIVSPKIVSEVIKPKLIKFISYDGFTKELLEELKKSKINKTIFTDLFIRDERFMNKLEEFSEVLIVDHHPSKDWNSKKTTFILGEEGYSAGFLCYYLFSKIKNIEKLDWLVACSCISDYCHIKPEVWLKKVFKKYGDTFKREGHHVKKDGVFWEMQDVINLALIYFRDNLHKAYESVGKEFGEVGDLKKYAGVIQKEIDENVKKFYMEKEIFDKGYFFKLNPKFPITSLISNIVSNENPKSVLVMIAPQGEFYKLSVRRQDRKFDCNHFVKSLLQGFEGAYGGGHIPAAGGAFRKADLAKFRSKLGLRSALNKSFK